MKDDIRQNTMLISDSRMNQAIWKLVEYLDYCTGWHLRRSQGYLKALMEQLIIDGAYAEELILWDMDIILLSSQLHDIGKLAISDGILNKPGKLTPQEFEIMKTHVQIGVEAIEKMERSTYCPDFLKHAKLFAAAHHEKWDGNGYPHGLQGLNIPLEGRIMAIADVYDALITVRPYKKALTADESSKIIIEGAGAHFDPVIVETFKKLQDDFASIAMKYADTM
ncbi:MAG: HD domain-containing protein [Clostridiales bacterium]|nr:HD domain-containing protein [Clostridiales bacterium]